MKPLLRQVAAAWDKLLQQKGALPKPWDWGSFSSGGSPPVDKHWQLETDRAAVLSQGAWVPQLPLRGEVSLPAGMSRTVACQASCLGQVSQMLYPETDCTEHALHREHPCCAAVTPRGPNVTHKSWARGEIQLPRTHPEKLWTVTGWAVPGHVLPVHFVLL